MEILSPASLWRDKNLYELPFDGNVVRVDTVDGVTYKQMYFTSELTDSGAAVRVFCRLALPSGAVKPPVIIVAEDSGWDFATRSINEYLERGYAVFQFDYSGAGDNVPRFTLYPEELAYCNCRLYPQAISEVVDPPQDSCWYTWSMITLRAVAFLRTQEEIDADRLRIFGVGAGGAHAIKACQMFSAIERCAVRYDVTLPISGSTNDAINLLATMGSASCVRLLTTPILMEVASNESNGSLDRITALFEKIGSSEKILSISQNENHSIGAQQANNRLLWLSGVDAPSLPILKANSSGGKLYYDIEVDAEHEPQSVEMFFSVGTADPTFRFWERCKVERAGENNYIARVSVADADDQCYAFGNVLYSSGYCLSTLPIRLVPKTLNIMSASSPKPRLLYDSEMGTDCWMVRDKEMRTAHDIVMAVGPLDIEGVSGVSGELTTLKLGDKRFGGGGSVLQISICAQNAESVSFKVIDNSGRVFECEEDVPTTWARLALSPQDFHGKGSFAWEDIVCLTVNSNTPVIISNIVWI